MDWILIAILHVGNHPVIAHSMFFSQHQCETVAAAMVERRPEVRVRCIPNAPAEQ